MDDYNSDNSNPVDRLDEIIESLKNDSDRLGSFVDYADALTQLQNAIRTNAEKMDSIAMSIETSENELKKMLEGNRVIVEKIEALTDQIQISNAEIKSTLTTKLLEIKNDIDLHSTNIVGNLSNKLDLATSEVIKEVDQHSSSILTNLNSKLDSATNETKKALADGTDAIQRKLSDTESAINGRIDTLEIKSNERFGHLNEKLLRLLGVFFRLKNRNTCFAIVAERWRRVDRSI
jgi:hypothetical protein